MLKTLWLVWVLLVASLVFLDKLAHGDVGGGPFLCSDEIDCGEPLLLTQLLKESNVFEAQQAAMVHFPNSSEFQEVQNVQSYSGFFTVNETVDSNIFFYFFPAETNPKDSPILLWLEGGPGCASISDVFSSSSGPLELGDDLRLTPGANRWTKAMNVLYLDSPVGAGFSFTKNVSGYARSQEDYTRDLYSAISQFFRLFPEHRTNDFFIAGISYAGKYIPALAYKIHEKNSDPNIVKINLRGIAIGNGLVNPLIQTEYSKYLYGIGLIDSDTKLEFEKIEHEIQALILNEEFSAASKKFWGYLFAYNGSESVITNMTGVSYDDYLTSNADEPKEGKTLENLPKMIVKPELRKSIHAGSQEFWIANDIYLGYLQDDIVRSVAPKLEVLMDNYRVVLYSGQLDIICNYRLMIDYVKQLNWGGAEEYGNATRHQWLVDGQLAGYSKTAGNFTEILVRNAGHAAHLYQPSWVLDLLKRLTQDLPFHKN